MAPTNLQGLNIVHPAIQTDAHDLLSGQSFPDLSAQLDLWTNLTFDSDEPIGSRNNDDKYSRKSLPDPDEEEEVRSPVTTEKAVHDGHVNVVTGTNLGTNQHQSAIHHQQQLPNFDITAFLAGFGIDPFALPPPQQQQHHPAPSLAQLLAFHSAVTHHTPGFTGATLPDVSPPNANDERPASFYSRTSTTSTADASSPEEAHPANKRSRTRKASISSVQSPEAESPAPLSGLSAAEDKRRRNTAASARFRLKKKEREAALEGKAKELETKVSELERECEGLRRENGWLKGLVVGVTGAAQGPIGPTSSLVAPASSISTASSTGTKRRRDDPDNA